MALGERNDNHLTKYFDLKLFLNFLEFLIHRNETKIRINPILFLIYQQIFFRCIKETVYHKNKILPEPRSMHQDFTSFKIGLKQTKHTSTIHEIQSHLHKLPPLYKLSLISQSHHRKQTYFSAKCTKLSKSSRKTSSQGKQAFYKVVCSRATNLQNPPESQKITIHQINSNFRV